MKILGIDPGLCHTGWGIIDFENNKLFKIACGVINPAATEPVSVRLAAIHKGLSEQIEKYHPHDCAIEQVFVNSNAETSLKLGLARGVALCVPALYGLAVKEYAPNKIKKTIVGIGHATKEQVGKMVQILLGGALETKDTADALAIAICHAQHLPTYKL